MTHAVLLINGAAASSRRWCDRCRTSSEAPRRVSRLRARGLSTRRHAVRSPACAPSRVASCRPLGNSIISRFLQILWQAVVGSCQICGESEWFHSEPKAAYAQKRSALEWAGTRPRARAALCGHMGAVSAGRWSPGWTVSCAAGVTTDLPIDCVLRKKASIPAGVHSVRIKFGFVQAATFHTPHRGAGSDFYAATLGFAGFRLDRIC